MDINVGMGEWINSLMSRMMNAADGDCFYLPTLMHLHAFQLVKDTSFPERIFKVEVEEKSKA
jgi:hypothetical protein